MFIDICFPNNNELQFIKIARKLNTKAVLFVYKEHKSFLERKPIKSDIIIYSGLETNLKVKNKLNFSFNLIISSSCKRKDIENNLIKLHYNFENIAHKDKIHFRNSGLNQVLCNILRRKNKIVGISFSNLFYSNIHIKIGRLIQNSKLLRKYNINTAVASFANLPKEMRSESNLKAFCSCIGMTPEQANRSLHTLSDFL